MWIFKAVRRRVRRRMQRGSRREYLRNREAARALVHERLEYFNTSYHFTYKKVAIRNQKSRWGSCSKAGNLNFNYRLILLPAHLIDYVIVHELCHRAEFNHSENFWVLVARTVPEYAARRRELRQMGRMLGTRAIVPIFASSPTLRAGPTTTR